MPKTKDQLVRVRVSPAGDRDEVFIVSAKWEPPEDDKSPAEPYINRAVYAKPGLFKDGEFNESDVAKLEEKSKVTLREEHTALLAKEAKEREAAEAETKATVSKVEGKK